MISTPCWDQLQNEARHDQLSQNRWTALIDALNHHGADIWTFDEIRVTGEAILKFDNLLNTGSLDGRTLHPKKNIKTLVSIHGSYRRRLAG